MRSEHFSAVAKQKRSALRPHRLHRHCSGIINIPFLHCSISQRELREKANKKWWREKTGERMPCILHIIIMWAGASVCVPALILNNRLIRVCARSMHISYYAIHFLPFSIGFAVVVVVGTNGFRNLFFLSSFSSTPSSSWRVCSQLQFEMEKQRGSGRERERESKFNGLDHLLARFVTISRLISFFDGFTIFSEPAQRFFVVVDVDVCVMPKPIARAHRHQRAPAAAIFIVRCHFFYLTVFFLASRVSCSSLYAVYGVCACNNNNNIQWRRIINGTSSNVNSTWIVF